MNNISIFLFVLTLSIAVIIIAALAVFFLKRVKENNSRTTSGDSGISDEKTLKTNADNLINETISTPENVQKRVLQHLLLGLAEIIKDNEYKISESASEKIIRMSEDKIKNEMKIMELLLRLNRDDAELKSYSDLINKSSKDIRDYEKIMQLNIDVMSKFDFILNTADPINSDLSFINEAAEFLNVVLINPEKGDSYITELHSVSSEEVDSSLSRGRVIRCIKLGYKDKYRVIQKAKIIISR